MERVWREFSHSVTRYFTIHGNVLVISCLHHLRHLLKSPFMHKIHFSSTVLLPSFLMLMVWMPCTKSKFDGMKSLEGFC